MGRSVSPCRLERDRLTVEGPVVVGGSCQVGGDAPDPWNLKPNSRLTRLSPGVGHSRWRAMRVTLTHSQPMPCSL